MAKAKKKAKKKASKKKAVPVVHSHSVDEAAWWFITMERSCQAQLLAEAAGTPVLIDPEMARHTSGQVGTHLAGWFSFQPLFERIVGQQPDLLD